MNTPAGLDAQMRRFVVYRYDPDSDDRPRMQWCASGSEWRRRAERCTQPRNAQGGETSSP